MAISIIPKLWMHIFIGVCGRGAFCRGRRGIAIAPGHYRREYADMSNDKNREIRFRRKPEVSWAMLVIPGLVGT